MYHSITFESSTQTKNTWDDWHLIPASRPVFSPPDVKSAIIDIPGADGSLDLTEMLTGKPTYRDRAGSWTFYVENGYGEWHERFTEIMMFLHGKRMEAWLEDDPDFYYEGRFSVSEWQSNPSHSSIVITYNVSPYKLYRYDFGDRWLWDTFSFETGLISDYKNIAIEKDGIMSVKVRWDLRDAVPSFIINSTGIRMRYNDNLYYLQKGTNTFDDVIVHNGEDNTFIFMNTGSSSAKITIKITGGLL